MTNESQTLAFVRISKCGSSTFSTRHKLFYWQDFSRHQDIFLTFCALREPRARFLSSIPETLCRIYSIQSKQTQHRFANVPIFNDIFFFLSEKIKESGSFVESFIKTIEEFGFFDAHHEPMVRFLINEKNELEVNPITINLEHIDILSEFIFSLDGTSSSSFLPRYNENSEKSIRDEIFSGFNSSLKDILLKLKSKIPGVSSHYKSIAISQGLSAIQFMNSIDYHPLKGKIIQEKLSWRQLKLSIYHEVKKESSTYRFDSFLNRFYSDDISVFASLKASYNSLTPQNLLSSAKRFKDLL